MITRNPSDERPRSPGAAVTAEGEALVSDPRRIRYVKTDAPQAGGHAHIASNLVWIRIPLPIDLNHINVWLVDTGTGYVAVDTGMAASMCKEAWHSIEAQLFNDKPLQAIFVTHLHPDHIGLAQWLQERYRVPVLMSARTEEAARSVYGADPPASEEVNAFLCAHGLVDSMALRAMLKPERFARVTSGVPSVQQYVEDGDKLEWGAGAWRAMRTDGHAEGHLCLWDATASVLISGDQVLPTISSNISVMLRNRDANPLGSYLDSLDRLRRLPEDALVLPSHGVPFFGLQHRIDDLRQHHEAQLAKISAACKRPTSAFELLPLLFRRELAGMHLFLAMGEAIAHLEYLVHAGQMERHAREGTIRYAT